MNHQAKVCRSRPNKKKNFFGHLPSADESDSEESSGRIVVGKLELHSISAEIYIYSPAPSNNPQLINLATDTGVSKTLLNRLDWEKVKHLCPFVKTSKHFRPFGRAYHLPIQGEAKVTLCAENGATIESYIYVIDNKWEQSLLGEKDAICLGIVKLHPQGASEHYLQINLNQKPRYPEESHILNEASPQKMASCQVEKPRQK